MRESIHICRWMFARLLMRTLPGVIHQHFVDSEVDSRLSYATAWPVNGIQHLTYQPTPLGNITFCGKFVATVSSVPQNTALGYQCRTCVRRGQRYARVRKESR
jgi:hypothetical protein